MRVEDLNSENVWENFRVHEFGLKTTCICHFNGELLYARQGNEMNYGPWTQ